MNYILAILLFSIIGMKALFHPGLYTAHDIGHQVVRLYYYFQAINDGQFPPYWVSQLANGFGYPLFFFSYNLPWLIGAPLLKIGLDIQSVIKILFFLSYIGSGFTMYLFANNLLKNKTAASLSAILYLWLPYHFLIILVGASMGIAFVFTFLPLVFLGIHLIKEESSRGVPILAIGFSGLILSHIMHLIFLFPASFIFLIWGFLCSKKRINFLKNICIGLTLGGLISSFYLIPAVHYNQFTRVHKETGFSELYKRNFINFSQLVYSKWGYGPIINNAKNNENSFQLGIAQWTSMIALFLLIVMKKLSKNYRRLSISLLLGFTISIFLMLDFSKPVWAILVNFTTVDFPFRLLLPATFIASICAGIILVNTKKRLQAFVFIFLLFITIYTNRNHINVNQYTNLPVSAYLNLETEKTTNTFNEYLPIRADTKLLNKPWNEILGENVSASNTGIATNLLTFNLTASKEENVSAGQFYFPGQTLYLDNGIIKYGIDQQGRINFRVQKGAHNVVIRYQETDLIKLSRYLTLIGILLIVWLLFRENLVLYQTRLMKLVRKYC